MNNNVFFTKVRPVKSPCRANKNDAGIDFYAPEFNKEFHKRLEEVNSKLTVTTKMVNNELVLTEIIVQPGDRVLLPSGIKVWIVNKDSAMIAFNKSGLSTKSGITVTAQVVDADYTGEVHLGLLNNSDEDFVIFPNQKVAQFIHLPYIKSHLSEVTSAQYAMMTTNSDRGASGFGSSDNK